MAGTETSSGHKHECKVQAGRIEGDNGGFNSGWRDAL
jgi:hypothetical protein